MAFHLRRTTDGVGDSGVRSQAIKFDKYGNFQEVVGHKPTIGCSILVGSLTARSYSDQDWWLTTSVTEILEEIEYDDVHYIRFKTTNSEYEWWNGVYPKSLSLRNDNYTTTDRGPREDNEASKGQLPRSNDTGVGHSWFI